MSSSTDSTKSQQALLGFVMPSVGAAREKAKSVFKRQDRTSLTFPVLKRRVEEVLVLLGVTPLPFMYLFYKGGLACLLILSQCFLSNDETFLDALCSEASQVFEKIGFSEAKVENLLSAYRTRFSHQGSLH